MIYSVAGRAGTICQWPDIADRDRPISARLAKSTGGLRFAPKRAAFEPAIARNLDGMKLAAASGVLQCIKKAACIFGLLSLFIER
jgi:hypothetical protein